MKRQSKDVLERQFWILKLDLIWLDRGLSSSQIWISKSPSKSTFQMMRYTYATRQSCKIPSLTIFDLTLTLLFVWHEAYMHIVYGAGFISWEALRNSLDSQLSLALYFNRLGERDGVDLWPKLRLFIGTSGQADYTVHSAFTWSWLACGLSKNFRLIPFS